VKLPLAQVEPVSKYRWVLSRLNFFLLFFFFLLTGNYKQGIIIAYNPYAIKMSMVGGYEIDQKGEGL
jgi:hypothetical protein